MRRSITASRFSSFCENHGLAFRVEGAGFIDSVVIMVRHSYHQSEDH